MRYKGYILLDLSSIRSDTTNCEDNV